MKLVKLSLMFALAALMACGATLSAAQLATFDSNEAACVTNSSTKAAADACRAKVRAAFCSQNPGLDSRCDGGAE